MRSIGSSSPRIAPRRPPTPQPWPPRSPRGDGRDFCDWFHASNGLYQADGPDGPLWKKFNEPMKNAILPVQQRNGSWQGGTLSHTIVRTSLAELTLQVYYRYSNIVGAAR